MIDQYTLFFLLQYSRYSIKFSNMGVSYFWRWGNAQACDKTVNLLRPIYLARRSGPHAFLWCWKKNKIENQYSTRYGWARPFIFAILNGRLIATRRPIARTVESVLRSWYRMCRRYYFLLFVPLHLDQY